MKRKLIFVILAAMILSPMNAFAGSVLLDYNRSNSLINVNGSDFEAGEMIAILGSFGNAPPSFLRADYISQETVKADGTFAKDIPTATQLYVGDEYSVLVGAASLAAASPLFKTVSLEGVSALLQAPLRYSIKVNRTETISASYNATGAVVTCSNTAVATAVGTYDGNDYLTGITVVGKKMGTAMITVKTPTTNAIISVTVTT